MKLDACWHPAGLVRAPQRPGSAGDQPHKLGYHRPPWAGGRPEGVRPTPALPSGRDHHQTP